jgi:predicted short-subunit dehydrogenase-like oxidoreductase (DUF2520 family)
MRRPYGLILDSSCTGITRAVLQDNDRVLIQILKVQHEVTMTLADLGALTGLVERADAGDPVLEELARVEALTVAVETVLREPGEEDTDD